MANYPIYRLVKGSTLTFTEMDGNLEWLSRTMSASVVTITGSTFVLGNLNVSDGITGSLFGTSSWAVSASWAPSNTSTISSFIATGSVTASVSNTNTSASFRVTSGSNTLLNVTKDGQLWLGSGTFINQGYQLDVNGTARISSNLRVANGNGNIYARTSTTINFVGSGAPVGIELPYVDGNKAATGFLYADNNYFTPTNMIGWNGFGVGIKNGILAADIINESSSIFSLSSTTQGFLSPRMTAAQRNAIAAPARGLIVYDTDTITEGLWFYNSGSNPGWQEVLTNSGSQSISGSITANSITVTGTLTAQTIVAQTITSSTDFVTGSTRFGSLLSNTHQFTGSVSVTGSLLVNNSSLVTGNGSTGQVTYWNGTNSQTGSALLNFNTTNNGNLLIGTTVNPAANGSGLAIYGTLYPRLTFRNSNTGDTVGVGMEFYMVGTNMFYDIKGANNQTWTSNATERMRLFGSTGNLVIGGTLASDSGQRLQVYGDTLLSGSGATSATNALLVQNSSNQQIFLVRNDGATIFGGPNVGTYLTTDKGQSITTGAGGMFLGYFATGDLGYVAVPSVTLGRPNNRLLNATSGTQIMSSIVGNYSPTSGTGLFIATEIVPTINQTGGANGITRGLYVNPTLTSASDFRAIETTAGNVLFGTSSAGFYWDNTNSRLGIGTNAPAYTLDTNGTFRVTGLGVSTGYSLSVQRLQFNNGTAGTNLGYIVGTSNGVIRLVNAAETDFTRLQFGGTTTAFPALQRSGSALCVVDGTGGSSSNLLIGGTVDASQRLQVYGTSLFTGYALFGSGNSGTPLATLTDFRGGSDTDFIQVARASTSSDRYVRIYANGQIDALSTKTDSAPYTFAAAANSNTSGTRGLFSITNTFNPTSGTATYTAFQINQTVSQSGGANGITRGLYVNPAIISASDWRSIEWSNNSGFGLYGAGTANNYLAGNLAVGPTTTWDAGVGTLSVVNGASDAPILSLKNTDATKQVYYASYNDTNKSLSYIVYGSSAAGTILGQSRANAAVILGYNSPSVLAIGNFNNVPLVFGTNNLERARITGAGRLLLGLTSESTFLLDVNGTARINGATTITGSLIATQGITGSLQGTSSWAVSASWAPSTGGVSGTYTPTLAAVYNVASSGSYELQYMRVGNVVTVGGTVELAATAANTWTRLAISLPISSTFDFSYRAGGGGAANATNNTCGIQAEAFSGTRVFLDSYPNTTGVLNYFFSFTYLIM